MSYFLHPSLQSIYSVVVFANYFPTKKRCAPIISILDDILLHCQSSATLEAAHNLLHTLTANPRFSASLESSAGVLNEILEDMGFAGLWRSCSFNLAQEQQDRTCFGLTEKLIEVSLFFFPFLVSLCGLCSWL
jgi:neurofibromin 1